MLHTFTSKTKTCFMFHDDAMTNNDFYEILNISSCAPDQKEQTTTIKNSTMVVVWVV